MQQDSDLEQKANKLSRALDKLMREYEQYFAGHRDVGPGKMRDRVDRMATQLARMGISGTEKQFRINRLLQRYRTYKAKWDRTMRKIEQGALERGVDFSMAAREQSDDADNRQDDEQQASKIVFDLEPIDADESDKIIDEAEEFAQFGLDPDDV